MKMALKIVGGLLVAFGLVDLIGSFADFDLWGGFIGVELPDLVWKYSAYIEIAIGYFLFNASKTASTQSTEAESV